LAHGTARPPELGIIAPAGRHRVRHQSARHRIAALIRDTVPLPTPTFLAATLIASNSLSVHPMRHIDPTMSRYPKRHRTQD